MLRIGQAETLLPATMATHRGTFAEQRALVFPGAIAGDLLPRLRALTHKTGFISNSLDNLGHQEIESPPVAGRAIDLLLSRASLFRWLEQVTGCETITRVNGTVARRRPAHGDGLDWHDDLNVPSRRLAVTIALDDLCYDGGLFELRRVGSADPIFSFKHEKAGTVVIFEVSARLEHRVQPLTGGGPRLVYAGWFVG